MKEHSHQNNKVLKFCIFLILVLMYFRLYFGVDSSDEGFYLALASFFAKGGQPFVNEWVAQQGAAVIFSPFVKLYLSIVGSSDGIVLFGRHFYFMISLFASWSVWRLCRKFITSDAALIPPMIPLVFHPGGIPNISYNTLGALGFLIGSSLIYSSYFISAKEVVNAFIGTIFLVISSFAYPSIFPASAFILFFSFCFAPKLRPDLQQGLRNWKHRRNIVQGILISAIPLLYVVFQDGSTPLATSFEFSNASPIQGGGLLKVKVIYISIVDNWRHGAIIIFMLILKLIWDTKSKRIWFNLSITFVLSILTFLFMQKIVGKYNLGDSSIFIIWLGLLAPLFYYFARSPENFKHLKAVWLLSIIVGLTTGWTSSVWVNTAIGFIPAAILSMYFMVCKYYNPTRVTSVFPAIFILICVGLPQFLHVYQESPIYKLKTFMKTGPFLGLLTTDWKLGILDEITKDLASVAHGRKTIFIANGDIPGWYLMTDLKPSGPTLWANSAVLSTPPQRQTEMFKDYFDTANRSPDVLLVASNTMAEEFPLTKYFLEKNYKIFIERANYTLYVKP